MLNGPDTRPPSDRLPYCWPSIRAVRSVHWSCGASALRLMLRTSKLLPGRVRSVNWPPLKPPFDTSYGLVDRELDTCASCGRLLPPKLRPFRVVEFWSAE